MTDEPETPATDKTPALHRVTLMLCGPCLSGAGGECHSPGCSLWMNTAPDRPILADADGHPTGADVWAEFNDVGPGGVVAVDGEFAVGAQVTAGDYEGNRCPAVVTGRDGRRVELRLDLDRFQDSAAMWRALREATA